MLTGKKGLIIGVANENSIAWGCAEVCHRYGAETALTYFNDKAKIYVEPLANHIQAKFLLPLDVTNSDQHESLFLTLEREWGQLDFIVHSIAFAPKTDLARPFIDSTAEGFAQAIDISCHSLVRLAKSALPMMKQGGSILTMSYHGAQKVVPGYGLMGPVKASLESAVKYLAADLGSMGIRVNAISTGPVRTRAASALNDFDELLYDSLNKSPLRQLTDINQVGEAAAFLVSDNSRQITGQIIYVDSGFSIQG